MRKLITTVTIRPTDAEAVAYGCDPKIFETVILTTPQGEEARVAGGLFERYCEEFFRAGLPAVDRAMRADGWMKQPGNVPAVVYRFFRQYNFNV